MTKFWFSLPQDFRFILIGAINTINGYIFMLSSQYLLGGHFSAQVVFVISFMLMSIPAHFGMRFLVFQNPGSYFLQYLRYMLSSLSSAAIGALSVYFCVDFFALSPYAGQTVGVTASAAASYISLKYFAFSHRFGLGIMADRFVGASRRTDEEL